MNVSYRTRRNLQRTGIIALVVILVAAAVWLCWFLWLERFVVYTRDQGAVLDMTMDPVVPEGEVAQPPEREEISIYYNEGDNAINTSRELTQIIGYYADATILSDMSAVETYIQTLPTGTPVMLDVKDPKGNFFYSSAVGSGRSSAVDTEAMDALIKKLDSKGMYLIARLPALRDYSFGLNHTDNGLFVSSGAYLWADDDYCYWLDPTKQGTVTYLVEIVSELKNLGFDEVVLDEFRFPDTDNLKFGGDRLEALNTAANTLVTTCATNSFALSFVSGTTGFAAPEGRSRLYVESAAAAEAAGIAAESGVADPTIQLVFLTEVHDTRFDAYSVLRPLDSAG